MISLIVFCLKSNLFLFDRKLQKGWNVILNLYVEDLKL